MSAALSKPGDFMRIQVAAVAAAIVLSACSTTGMGGRPASPGAMSASATPAAPETIISAMGGGLIGGAIGSGLSESDRRSALQAEYRALEYTPAGNAVEWQGAGGRGGAVTAAQPYRVGSQDCRQYTHTVLLAGGQRQTARGTACRNPDGSWTPLT